jgi:acyl-CoA synthetase (AMP-forming)/AMP-acid ligase II
MIHNSPWPATAAPDVGFAQQVLARAAAFGERAALVDAASGHALSYAQLADGAARIGAALARRGLAPGEVVAVWLPNGAEHALALLGAWLAGAAVLPLNPQLRPTELARLLEDAGARYLVAPPAAIEAARDALAGCALREVFAVGEAPSATPFAALLADEPRLPVRVDPAAVALLPYSSGTTGLPKGVMLSHRALAANARQMAQWPLPAEEHTVAVCVAPMFHAFGVVLYHGVLLARGATIVSAPRYELESFLQAIERYRATYAAIVQPLGRALLESGVVPRFDLSTLARITCGSAALGQALSGALERRIGAPVFESYGMTEICGASHAQRPGDPRASVGAALAGNQWKIIDPDSGAPLPDGQDGEICLRGPSVMTGYLRRPRETAGCLDAEGWLRSGDLGRADAEGRLYVTGRLKELIKVGGYQVAPAELEALLVTHPGVAEACVIGEADGAGGEAPVAYVVCKTPVSAATLQSLVAANVAPFKRLREVIFVASLPRSHAGKVLRRELARVKEINPKTSLDK